MPVPRPSNPSACQYTITWNTGTPVYLNVNASFIDNISYHILMGGVLLFWLTGHVRRPSQNIITLNFMMFNFASARALRDRGEGGHSSSTILAVYYCLAANEIID